MLELISNIWQAIASNANQFYDWFTAPRTDMQIILWIVRYLSIFCIVLFLLMIKLRPRARVDWAFAWLILALGLVCLQIVYNTHHPSQFSIFIRMLTWLDLGVAITYCVYAVLADRLIRHNIFQGINRNMAKGRRTNGHTN